MDGRVVMSLSKMYRSHYLTHTLSLAPVRPDVLNVFLLELAQSSHLDNRLSRTSSWEQLMILDLNNYHSAA